LLSDLVQTEHLLRKEGIKGQRRLATSESC
jgi:hypothetical protein